MEQHPSTLPAGDDVDLSLFMNTQSLGDETFYDVRSAGGSSQDMARGNVGAGYDNYAAQPRDSVGQDIYPAVQEGGGHNVYPPMQEGGHNAVDLRYFGNIVRHGAHSVQIYLHSFSDGLY
jgi:hypothetical protein